MKRIDILVYRDDPPLTESMYLLHFLIAAWQETGYEVWVVSGPQEKAEGDIVLVHVNLTVVPDDHVEFARRFPIVINGRPTDISKRRVSRDLVAYDDAYDGPVIVKTNLNHGGLREGMHEAMSSPVQWYIHSQQENLPWWQRSELRSADYRIFRAKSEVPEPVWTNPALVVEKFLAELNDGHYALRTWLFFGDREMCSVGYAREPIVKGRHIVRREEADVPDEMRQMRAELGFDYGKFDYVIVDGRAVLFDANRTPTLGNRSTEAYRERGRDLAQGIRAFL
jgi:hypothetical protein